MCSRHPEEGAGSEYVHFDTDKVEWWHELHSLPPIVPPPWIARAVNGGWDTPQTPKHQTDDVHSESV